MDVHAVHAQAEALPLEGPFDLLVIADALHFLDAERTGHELALRSRPALRAPIVLTFTREGQVRAALLRYAD